MANRIFEVRCRLIADGSSTSGFIEQVTAAFRNAQVNLGVGIAPGVVRQTGKLSEGFTNVDRAARAAAKGTKEVTAEIASSANALERFSAQAGLASRRFVSFILGAGAIYKFGQALRDGTTNALQFQDTMIKIGQVGSESKAQIAALGDNVGSLAARFGLSSRSLAENALIFKQVGLSAQEVQGHLETLALTSLAPNFENDKNTAEGMIAVIRQFKTDVDQTRNAMGALNAVAGAFAVEAVDLVEAVRKSGGAFSATGGDLNEFISLFTSVRSTTRESAAEIATGLRTIFTRLQRSQTEEALRGLGVQLRFTKEEANELGKVNLTNQFVGGYEAIRRISQALQTIPTTDPRFIQIVEQLGGYRQISRVIPLIQQFGEAEKAKNVALAGGISLTVDADKAQESLSRRIASTREQFLGLSRNFLNSEGFQAFARHALSLANAFIQILDIARPLIPVLAALAAVKLSQSISGIVTNLKDNFLGNTATSFLAKKPTQKLATGGRVLGFGSGDRVPVMLEAGEHVIDKLTASTVGHTNLDKMRAAGGRLNMGGQYDPQCYDNGGLTSKPSRIVHKRLMSVVGKITGAGEGIVPSLQDAIGFSETALGHSKQEEYVQAMRLHIETADKLSGFAVDPLRIHKNEYNEDPNKKYSIPIQGEFFKTKKQAIQRRQEILETDEYIAYWHDRSKKFRKAQKAHEQAASTIHQETGGGSQYFANGGELAGKPIRSPAQYNHPTYGLLKSLPKDNSLLKEVQARIIDAYGIDPLKTGFPVMVGGVEGPGRPVSFIDQKRRNPNGVFSWNEDDNNPNITSEHFTAIFPGNIFPKKRENVAWTLGHELGHSLDFDIGQKITSKPLISIQQPFMKSIIGGLTGARFSSKEEMESAVLESFANQFASSIFNTQRSKPSDFSGFATEFNEFLTSKKIRDVYAPGAARLAIGGETEAYQKLPSNLAASAREAMAQAKEERAIHVQMPGRKQTFLPTTDPDVVESGGMKYRRQSLAEVGIEIPRGYASGGEAKRKFQTLFTKSGLAYAGRDNYKFHDEVDQWRDGPPNQETIKQFGGVQSLIDLAGAPQDSKGVLFSNLDEPDTVQLYGKFSGGSFQRSFDPAKPKEIYNNDIYIKDDRRREGLATGIYARQLQAASQSGFEAIRFKAAGQKGDLMSGYTAWASFGADGLIPESVKRTASSANIPDDVREYILNGKATVQGLIAMPDGNDIWTSIGKGFNAKIDLTKDLAYEKGAERLQNLVNRRKKFVIGGKITPQDHAETYDDIRTHIKRQAARRTGDTEIQPTKPGLFEKLKSFFVKPKAEPFQFVDENSGFAEAYQKAMQEVRETTYLLGVNDIFATNLSESVPLRQFSIEQPERFNTITAKLQGNLASAASWAQRVKFDKAVQDLSIKQLELTQLKVAASQYAAPKQVPVKGTAGRAEVITARIQELQKLGVPEGLLRSRIAEEFQLKDATARSYLRKLDIKPLKQKPVTRVAKPQETADPTWLQFDADSGDTELGFAKGGNVPRPRGYARGDNVETRKHFMADILENHEGRLVYSDWLEEIGSTEEASEQRKLYEQMSNVSIDELKKMNPWDFNKKKPVRQRLFPSVWAAPEGPDQAEANLKTGFESFIKGAKHPSRTEAGSFTFNTVHGFDNASDIYHNEVSGLDTFDPQTHKLNERSSPAYIIPLRMAQSLRYQVEKHDFEDIKDKEFTPLQYAERNLNKYLKQTPLYPYPEKSEIPDLQREKLERLVQQHKAGGEEIQSKTSLLQLPGKQTSIKSLDEPNKFEVYGMKVSREALQSVGINPPKHKASPANAAHGYVFGDEIDPKFVKFMRQAQDLTDDVYHKSYQSLGVNVTQSRARHSIRLASATLQPDVLENLSLDDNIEGKGVFAYGFATPNQEQAIRVQPHTAADLAKILHEEINATEPLERYASIDRPKIEGILQPDKVIKTKSATIEYLPYVDTFKELTPEAKKVREHLRQLVDKQGYEFFDYRNLGNFGKIRKTGEPVILDPGATDKFETWAPPTRQKRAFGGDLEQRRILQQEAHKDSDSRLIYSDFLEQSGDQKEAERQRNIHQLFKSVPKTIGSFFDFASTYINLPRSITREANEPGYNKFISGSKHRGGTGYLSAKFLYDEGPGLFLPSPKQIEEAHSIRDEIEYPTQDIHFGQHIDNLDKTNVPHAELVAAIVRRTERARLFNSGTFDLKENLSDKSQQAYERIGQRLTSKHVMGGSPANTPQGYNSGEEINNRRLPRLSPALKPADSKALLAQLEEHLAPDIAKSENVIAQNNVRHSRLLTNEALLEENLQYLPEGVKYGGNGLAGVFFQHDDKVGYRIQPKIAPELGKTYLENLGEKQLDPSFYSTERPNLRGVLQPHAVVETESAYIEQVPIYKTLDKYNPSTQSAAMRRVRNVLGKQGRSLQDTKPQNVGILGDEILVGDPGSLGYQQGKFGSSSVKTVKYAKGGNIQEVEQRKLFLADILENHDARLMYSDWLEERGHNEEAVDQRKLYEQMSTANIKELKKVKPYQAFEQIIPEEYRSSTVNLPHQRGFESFIKGDPHPERTGYQDRQGFDEALHAYTRGLDEYGSPANSFAQSVRYHVEKRQLANIKQMKLTPFEYARKNENDYIDQTPRLLSYNEDQIAEHTEKLRRLSRLAMSREATGGELVRKYSTAGEVEAENRRNFYRQFQTKPETRLIYADYLEERGEYEAAKGHRTAYSGLANFKPSKHLTKVLPWTRFAYANIDNHDIIPPGLDGLPAVAKRDGFVNSDYEKYSKVLSKGFAPHGIIAQAVILQTEKNRLEKHGTTDVETTRYEGYDQLRQNLAYWHPTSSTAGHAPAGLALGGSPAKGYQGGDSITAFHGTPNADFDEFDLDHTGKNIDSGFLGKGFYFSNNKEVAKYYARRNGSIIAADLKLENPFMWGPKTLGVRGLNIRGEKLPDVIHDDVIKQTGFSFDDSKDPDFLQETILSEAVRNALINLGHDGVIADTKKDEKEYVAFYPKQIQRLGVEKAFATGGGVQRFNRGSLVVPGFGNTDQFIPEIPSLPAGSFVIKKSSAEKIGHAKLAEWGRNGKTRFDTGGGSSRDVPVELVPGEHVFLPEAAARIGSYALHEMNTHGRLPRATGGRVGFVKGEEVDYVAKIQALRDNIDNTTLAEIAKVINELKTAGVEQVKSVAASFGSTSKQSRLKNLNFSIDKLLSLKSDRTNAPAFERAAPLPRDPRNPKDQIGFVNEEINPNNIIRAAGAQSVHQRPEGTTEQKTDLRQIQFVSEYEETSKVFKKIQKAADKLGGVIDETTAVFLDAKGNFKGFASLRPKKVEKLTEVAPPPTIEFTKKPGVIEQESPENQARIAATITPPKAIKPVPNTAEQAQQHLNDYINKEVESYASVYKEKFGYDLDDDQKHQIRQQAYPNLQRSIANKAFGFLDKGDVTIGNKVLPGGEAYSIADQAIGRAAFTYDPSQNVPFGAYALTIGEQIATDKDRQQRGLLRLDNVNEDGEPKYRKLLSLNALNSEGQQIDVAEREANTSDPNKHDLVSALALRQQLVQNADFLESPESKGRIKETIANLPDANFIDDEGKQQSIRGKSAAATAANARKAAAQLDDVLTQLGVAIPTEVPKLELPPKSAPAPVKPDFDEPDYSQFSSFSVIKNKAFGKVDSDTPGPVKESKIGPEDKETLLNRLRIKSASVTTPGNTVADLKKYSLSPDDKFDKLNAPELISEKIDFSRLHNKLTNLKIDESEKTFAEIPGPPIQFSKSPPQLRNLEFGEVPQRFQEQENRRATEAKKALDEQRQDPRRPAFVSGASLPSGPSQEAFAKFQQTFTRFTSEAIGGARAKTAAQKLLDTHGENLTSEQREGLLGGIAKVRTRAKKVPQQEPVPEATTPPQQRISLPVLQPSKPLPIVGIPKVSQPPLLIGRTSDVTSVTPPQLPDLAKSFGRFGERNDPRYVPGVPGFSQIPEDVKFKPYEFKETQTPVGSPAKAIESQASTLPVKREDLVKYIKSIENAAPEQIQDISKHLSGLTPNVVRQVAKDLGANKKESQSRFRGVQFIQQKLQSDKGFNQEDIDTNQISPELIKKQQRAQTLFTNFVGEGKTKATQFARIQSGRGRKQDFGRVNELIEQHGEFLAPEQLQRLQGLAAKAQIIAPPSVAPPQVFTPEPLPLGTLKLPEVRAFQNPQKVTKETLAPPLVKKVEFKDEVISSPAKTAQTSSSGNIASSAPPQPKAPKAPKPPNKPPVNTASPGAPLPDPLNTNPPNAPPNTFFDSGFASDSGNNDLNKRPLRPLREAYLRLQQAKTDPERYDLLRNFEEKELFFGAIPVGPFKPDELDRLSHDFLTDDEKSGVSVRNKPLQILKKRLEKNVFADRLGGLPSSQGVKQEDELYGPQPLSKNPYAYVDLNAPIPYDGRAYGPPAPLPPTASSIKDLAEPERQRQQRKVLGLKANEPVNLDFLSTETKVNTSRAALDSTKNSLSRELLNAQKNWISAINKNITAAELEKLAAEHVADALEGRARIVKSSTGKVLGVETNITKTGNVNQATGETFSQNAGQLFSSLFSGAKDIAKIGFDAFNQTGVGNRTTRIASSIGRGTNATLKYAGEKLQHPGLIFAAPLIAEQFQRNAGTAEEAIASPGNEFGFKARRAIGGTAQSAILGATLGAGFGPQGAAIGAVIGGITGFIDSLKDAEKEIREVKIGKALSVIQDRLNALGNAPVRINASGTASLDVSSSYAGEILNELSTARTQSTQQNTRDNSSKTRSAGNFITGALNRFGLLPSSLVVDPVNVAGFAQSQISSTRSQTAQQLPGIMQVLARDIEVLTRNTGGNVPAATLLPKLVGGAGSLNDKLIENVAIARDIPRAAFEEELTRLIHRANQNIRIENQNKDAKLAEDRTVFAFNRLTLSVQAASNSLKSLQIHSSAIADLFDGHASPAQVNFHAERLQQFGRPDGGAIEPLRILASVGGETGADVLRLGTAVDRFAAILPGVLARVGSTNPEEGVDFVTKVREQLDTALRAQGQDPNSSENKRIIASIINNLNEVGGKNVADIQKKIQIDVSQFSLDLLKNLIGPIADTGKAIKLIEDEANRFATGLAKVSQQTAKVGEAFDKAANVRIQSARIQSEVMATQEGRRSDPLRYFSLETAQSGLQARQERLTGQTGEAANDPEAISNELQRLLRRIPASTANANAIVNAAPNSENATNALTYLQGLKDKAVRLQEALGHLADVAGRNAAIQERLSQIQRDRESRQSFAERVARLKAEDLPEFNRTILLTEQARQTGQLPEFSEDRGRVIDFLRSLGDANLDAFGGERPKDILERLLSGFANIHGWGGIGQVSQGSLAEERRLQGQLVSNAQTGERAAQLAAEFLNKASGDFLTQLLATHRSFFAELKTILSKESITDVKNQIGQAGTESGHLGSIVRARGELDVAGITNQEDVKKFLKNRSLVETYFTNRTARQTTAATFDSARRNSGEILTQTFGQNFGSVDSGTLTGPRLIEALQNAGLQSQVVAISARFQTNLNTPRRRQNGGTTGPLISPQDHARESLEEAISTSQGTQDRVLQAAGQSNVTQLTNEGITPASLDQVFNQGTEGLNRFRSALDAFQSGATLENLNGRLASLKDRFRELNDALVEMEAGRPRPPRAAPPQVEFVPQQLLPGLNFRFPPDFQSFDAPPGFATGGRVSTQPIGFPAKGTDTVRAMLTPQEYVVNRQSAIANASLLEEINAARGPVRLNKGGYAHRQERAQGGGIRYLADGGSVQYLEEGTPRRSLADRISTQGVRGNPREILRYVANLSLGTSVDTETLFNNILLTNQELEGGASGLFNQETRDISLFRRRPDVLGHEIGHGADLHLANTDRVIRGRALVLGHQFINANPNLGIASANTADEGVAELFRLSGSTNIPETAKPFVERFRREVLPALPQLSPQRTAALQVQSLNETQRSLYNAQRGFGADHTRAFSQASGLQPQIEEPEVASIAQDVGRRTRRLLGPRNIRAVSNLASSVGTGISNLVSSAGTGASNLVSRGVSEATTALAPARNVIGNTFADARGAFRITRTGVSNFLGNVAASIDNAYVSSPVTEHLDELAFATPAEPRPGRLKTALSYLNPFEYRVVKAARYGINQVPGVLNRLVTNVSSGPTFAGVFPAPQQAFPAVPTPSVSTPPTGKLAAPPQVVNGRLVVASPITPSSPQLPATPPQIVNGRLVVTAPLTPNFPPEVAPAPQPSLLDRPVINNRLYTQTIDPRDIPRQPVTLRAPTPRTALPIVSAAAPPQLPFGPPQQLGPPLSQLSNISPPQLPPRPALPNLTQSFNTSNSFATPRVGSYTPLNYSGSPANTLAASLPSRPYSPLALGTSTSPTTPFTPAPPRPSQVIVAPSTSPYSIQNISGNYSAGAVERPVFTTPMTPVRQPGFFRAPTAAQTLPFIGLAALAFNHYANQQVDGQPRISQGIQDIANTGFAGAGGLGAGAGGAALAGLAIGNIAASNLDPRYRQAANRTGAAFQGVNQNVADNLGNYVLDAEQSGGDDLARLGRRRRALALAALQQVGTEIGTGIATQLATPFTYVGTATNELIDARAQGRILDRQRVEDQKYREYKALYQQGRQQAFNDYLGELTPVSEQFDTAVERTRFSKSDDYGTDANRQFDLKTSRHLINRHRIVNILRGENDYMAPLRKFIYDNRETNLSILPDRLQSDPSADIPSQEDFDATISSSGYYRNIITQRAVLERLHDAYEVKKLDELIELSEFNPRQLPDTHVKITDFNENKQRFFTTGYNELQSLISVLEREKHESAVHTILERDRAAIAEQENSNQPIRDEYARQSVVLSDYRSLFTFPENDEVISRVNRNLGESIIKGLDVERVSSYAQPGFGLFGYGFRQQNLINEIRGEQIPIIENSIPEGSGPEALPRGWREIYQKYVADAQSQVIPFKTGGTVPGASPSKDFLKSVQYCAEGGSITAVNRDILDNSFQALPGLPVSTIGGAQPSPFPGIRLSETTGGFSPIALPTLPGAPTLTPVSINTPTPSNPYSNESQLEAFEATYANSPATPTAAAGLRISAVGATAAPTTRTSVRLSPNNPITAYADWQQSQLRNPTPYISSGNIQLSPGNPFAAQPAENVPGSVNSRLSPNNPFYTPPVGSPANATPRRVVSNPVTDFIEYQQREAVISQAQAAGFGDYAEALIPARRTPLPQFSPGNPYATQAAPSGSVNSRLSPNNPFYTSADSPAQAPIRLSPNNPIHAQYQDFERELSRNRPITPRQQNVLFNGEQQQSRRPRRFAGGGVITHTIPYREIDSVLDEPNLLAHPGPRQRSPQRPLVGPQQTFSILGEEPIVPNQLAPIVPRRQAFAPANATILSTPQQQALQASFGNPLANLPTPPEPGLPAHLQEQFEAATNPFGGAAVAINARAAGADFDFNLQRMYTRRGVLLDLPRLTRAQRIELAYLNTQLNRDTTEERRDFIGRQSADRIHKGAVRAFRRATQFANFGNAFAHFGFGQPGIESQNNIGSNILQRGIEFQNALGQQDADSARIRDRQLQPPLVPAPRPFGFATGGDVKNGVPVVLTPGEIVYGPETTRQVGEKNLQQLNKGAFEVPGTGSTDSYYTTLPPGSFVLNKQASQKVKGFAKGGTVEGQYGYQTSESGIPYYGLNAEREVNTPQQAPPTASPAQPSVPPLDINPAVLQAMNEFGVTTTAFGNSVQTLNNIFNIFNASADKLAQAFANFPQAMTITGQHTVEVILNGAEVLTAIKGDLQEHIEKSIKDVIKDKFASIISDAGISME